MLVRLSDGRIVNVELWDFHGPVADQRGTALLSTFFDASIICHDMADVRNLKSLANVVSPARTPGPETEKPILFCPRTH